MTERHSTPTRYLTFKLDRGALNLELYHASVLATIADSPEGITFGEIRERINIGPQRLKAILRTLFERDYIITNHQMAKLAEKGIDVQKLRRVQP